MAFYRQSRPSASIDLRPAAHDFSSSGASPECGRGAIAFRDGHAGGLARQGAEKLCALPSRARSYDGIENIPRQMTPPAAEQRKSAAPSAISRMTARRRPWPVCQHQVGRRREYCEKRTSCPSRVSLPDIARYLIIGFADVEASCHRAGHANYRVPSCHIVIAMKHHDGFSDWRDMAASREAL